MQLYADDLPAPLSFDAELDLWQQQWTANPDLASVLSTPEKALCHADKDFYPNIDVLLRIMATLPVTSCECERSISLLRLVKSSLRSSMGQDRLNGLALLHSHQGSFVTLTPEEVVEEFVTRFYKTDPNRTSGNIKLTPPVDSYTIVLLVLTLSTTQTT